MVRYKPEYIMGYSSLVYQFAQYLKHLHIDGAILKLKMVKVTAESLFPIQRTLIEEVFACPVALEYGAAEVGIISFECPEHRHHIASECVFVEEISSDIIKEKELLISDLNNFLTPIIRYRLGDYGELSNETCPCGRGLPLLKRIVGRCSDIVYKADNTPVHSSIFSYILKDITGASGGISQYKIYQDKRGYLSIEIVKNENFIDATLNRLIENIHSHLGNDMIIDVSYTDQIKRDPSGKLRYFVSKV